MKSIIVMVLLSLNMYAQTQEIVEIYQEGDKAFFDQDYEKAKSVYASLTKIDSENKKSWFNLGVVELNLGNTEEACQCMKKAHFMRHPETLKILKDFCSEYFTPFAQLDVKPKFKHKDKTYDLFSERNRLNSKYLEILLKKISSSYFLTNELTPGGRILVNIFLTKTGPEFKVIRMPASPEKVEKATLAITEIFESFDYEPAKYQGKNVDVLEPWAIPIVISRELRPNRDSAPYSNGDGRAVKFTIYE